MCRQFFWLYLQVAGTILRPERYDYGGAHCGVLVQKRCRDRLVVVEVEGEGEEEDHLVEELRQREI